MNAIIILIIILIICILILIRNNKSGFENMKNIKKYKLAYNLGINFLNNFDKNVENPAVMFDIDDTLLYSSPELQEKGISFIPIKPIIEILNECLRRGIIVLIITARDSKFRAHAIQDLKDNGIEYDYLYLRENPRDNHEEFKSDIKKYLLENYKITTIMSLGDNLIDIYGRYSGYGLKLPNKTDPKLYEKKYGNLILIKT